jgi:hypothetical protein
MNMDPSSTAERSASSSAWFHRMCAFATAETVGDALYCAKGTIADRGQ